jgi:predicted kinase
MAGPPPLVLVGGAPAAGKTTVALPVARRLRLPLLEKDRIKEALMDSLDSGTFERSRQLGRATFTVLWALAARTIEAGVGAVVEANFDREALAAELARLPRSWPVMIHCSAPEEELLSRYRRRAAGRHPGHQDQDPRRLETIREGLRLGTFEPPDLPRVLRVDTGAPVELEAIVGWALEAIRAPAG